MFPPEVLLPLEIIASALPSFNPKQLIFVDVINVDGENELSYTITFSVNILHEFASVAVIEKLPAHKLL